MKPGNFLEGIGTQRNTVYIIDFGLAKSYKDVNGKHIPYSEGKGLVGTARYASIKTHMGIDQTRRDDLFSLGYVLLYWAKGGLPWQGVKGKSRKDKNLKIKDLKMSIGFESLCKNLPEGFAKYLEACYKLGFAEEPNYKYLRELFGNVDDGLVFDWLVPKMPENSVEEDKKKEEEENGLVIKQSEMATNETVLKSTF